MTTVLKPAWDEQPYRPAPLSMTSSWALSRAPPSHKPATTLKVTSIRSKDPKILQEISSAMTITDVKAAYARELHISCRKAITLRWHGKDLEEEDATLDALHIPDGAVLEAAFRTRSPPELKAFEQVEQVLLVDLNTGDGGGAIILEVNSSSQIKTIKETLKAPPTAVIYFTPFFTSNFGPPLDDERTLGSYHVLNGDVLYFSSGTPPAPPADAAAAPKKK